MHQEKKDQGLVQRLTHEKGAFVECMNEAKDSWWVVGQGWVGGTVSSGLGEIWFSSNPIREIE